MYQRKHIGPGGGGLELLHELKDQLLPSFKIK
jgi:hypothetical protein